MENKSRLHIVFVLSAMTLFSVFTLMHEFDWLLPPSPVETVASLSNVPMPDAMEEHGSEDEIEHDDFEIIHIPPLVSHNKKYMIYGDLFVPRVATPPPDKA